MTTADRIAKKVAKVKSQFPYCRNEDEILRMAKLEIQGDQWEELHEALDDKEHEILERLSKQFKNFRYKLHKTFLDNGHRAATEQMDVFLKGYDEL